MTSFIIGFDITLLVIEIFLFVLLVYIIKKYERTKEINLSLLNWLMVVVIYLVLTGIVSSIFK
jgi:multisubunit Na+/H+ antiporter MnhB subunit